MAVGSVREEKIEKLYEGMFLLNSGKYASDPDGVSNQVVGILEKAGATVVAHRPWQDGRLAYLIEGHRKGLHFLTYFRMDGQGLSDVTRACKLNDVILRHLVIKQPKKLFDAMVAALNGDEASKQPSPEKTPSPEKAPSSEKVPKVESNTSEDSNDTKATEATEAAKAGEATKDVDSHDGD